MNHLGRKKSSLEDPEELEDNNNEYTIDNSFIQETVEVEAESTITESISITKSNNSDSDESSYSDSYNASESEDDSVISVNCQSIH